MSREELELIRELWQLCDLIPSFAMSFAGSELTVDAEIAFVHRLADMGEALLCHANARRGLTVIGEPAILVVDADSTPSCGQMLLQLEGGATGD